MFVGIAVKRTYLCIGFSTGLYATSYIEEQVDSLPSLEGKVMKHLRAYSEKKNRKILAAGLTSDERILWLHMDILPFQFCMSSVSSLLLNFTAWKSSEISAEEQAYRNASKVEKHFNINSRNIETLVKEGSYFHCMPSLDYQYEVHVDFGKVHLVRLEDYKHTHCSPELWNQTMALAQHWRREKKRISFINATPQGGGVALMRHALIRLLRLLEVPCGWHVVRPSSKVFEITKRKFHNVLQGVAPPDCVLNEADKAKYLKWSAKNASFLEETIRKSAMIVIDDPQVVGLIPHIARINPSIRIIFRSHIEIRSDLVAIPNSPQAITWEFLWGFIQHCDLYIAHPVPRFVPANVSRTAVVLMPATTDPLDGLNKNLAPRDIAFYMKTFDLYLAGSHQTPLDPKRPYIAQIGRFDPSKGLVDCMKAYSILCERFPADKRPQLVLAGHGSIDDPDKEPILAQLMKLKASTEFAELAADIKTVVLPAKDQLLNVVLRLAKVAWQLSLREGFEVKVTEALLKGVPVVATKAGGIPLQIRDGETGFLVEIGDVQQVAEHTYKLLIDEKYRHKIGQAASSTINEEFLTVSNACNWLWLGMQLQKGCISGHFRGVPELVRKWFCQHKDKYEDHVRMHYGAATPTPVLQTPRCTNKLQQQQHEEM